VTVGGPFASLQALVRSEGIRRYAKRGEGTGDASPVEVFEWAEAFFRLDGSGEPGRFGSLEEAIGG
jgi:hypothetical protein